MVSTFFICYKLFGITAKIEKRVKARFAWISFFKYVTNSQGQQQEQEKE